MKMKYLEYYRINESLTEDDRLQIEDIFVFLSDDFNLSLDSESNKNGYINISLYDTGIITVIRITNTNTDMTLFEKELTLVIDRIKRFGYYIEINTWGYLKKIVNPFDFSEEKNILYSIYIKKNNV
jgi:hypothetical protein